MLVGLRGWAREAKVRQVLRVVLVAGALVSAACGGDREPTAGQETNPAPTASPATTTTLNDTSAERDEVARGYLDAFAAGDPETMSAMHEFAEPGSVADVYATHQIAVTKAFRDAGAPFLGQRVTYRGDEAEVCSIEGETCGIWADFTTDPESGLLTGFTIDGQPLDGRLLGGSGESTSATGATFTLVSAYKSVQGDSLFVVVEVENGPEPVTIYPSSAEYVTPDGRQVTAVDGVGPTELRPSAKATYVPVFDGADLGGTVYIVGYAEQDQSEFEVELALK